MFFTEASKKFQKHAASGKMLQRRRDLLMPVLDVKLFLGFQNL